MARFKKHDFGFFSSKEELQNAIARKRASICFEVANEDVSMNEFHRMYLKMLLMDAVSLGLDPTLLVKDRLEQLLDDDTDNFVNLMKGEKAEDLTGEEILKMWKEMMLEEFKGMTENEIYDVISKQ